MPLTVRIVTPERALPAAEADHVTLPASDGQIGVRPGHAPLVAMLNAGKVLVKRKSAADHAWAVRGGVARVLKDEITVLADAVVDSGEVSEEQSLARLNKLLAEPPTEHEALVAARAEAQWIAAQLKAAGKPVPDLSRLGL